MIGECEERAIREVAERASTVQAVAVGVAVTVGLAVGAAILAVVLTQLGHVDYLHGFAVVVATSFVPPIVVLVWTARRLAPHLVDARLESWIDEAARRHGVAPHLLREAATVWRGQ